MANLEKNVEQQVSSSVSNDGQSSASTSIGPNVVSNEEGCGHKSREILRAGKRKPEQDLQSEMTESGATPTKNACQSPSSPSYKSRSRSRGGGLRQQVQTSYANLAAIMKPPDSSKQQGVVENQSNTSASAKASTSDQRVDGQADRVNVLHQTKQDAAPRIQATVNQHDAANRKAATDNLALGSVVGDQQDTTYKNATANSATELRAIVDGLAKSLPNDKLQYNFDISLPQVDEWMSELHDKLKGELKWPDVSEMDVVGNYNAFVDLPIKLLAEKLNWLLRSREEALQNIMKWQTTPPKISVLPHWMLFPKFTQRTDFSKNMHLFGAQLEQAYAKQITVHFIECFRNIQMEIDEIAKQRPECVVQLTNEQQSELHNKQAKSKVRFSQITKSTKPASAASCPNTTSSRLAMSSSNMNATSSINATSANNATTASNVIASSSKDATSVNDNVAMDTAPFGAQSDNSVNKPAAPWPGKPNAQRRRRGNSNRRNHHNRYAPLQSNAPQTGRPIYNRQFWNSNYYNNNNRQQPWTHYNHYNQYGPFRYSKYYNSYNRGGGYYRYSSGGQNHNYPPPWRNHYEHLPSSNRYDYASRGLYETQYRGTGASWQPYGNYQSYGGYSY
jgi:hypothetical protein